MLNKIIEQETLKSIQITALNILKVSVSQPVVHRPLNGTRVLLHLQLLLLFCKEKLLKQRFVVNFYI